MKNFITLNLFFSVIYIISLHASEQLSITQLPSEILYNIIAYAYANYDDPIEFTYIRTVCTQWNNITQNANFKGLAEEKGFVEPVMIFHALNFSQQTDPIILEKDITSEKNITHLYYVNYDNINTNSQYPKGFFWQGKQAYLAIFINPIKTTVYNYYLNKNKQKNSQMSLQKYILIQKKVNLAKPNDCNNKIVSHHITAEAHEVMKNEMYWASYTTPAIDVPTPIVAQKFVKKWPKTITFKRKNEGSFIELGEPAAFFSYDLD